MEFTRSDHNRKRQTILITTTYFHMIARVTWIRQQRTVSYIFQVKDCNYIYFLMIITIAMIVEVKLRFILVIDHPSIWKPAFKYSVNGLFKQ